MAGVYDESVVTTKGGLVTMSQNAGLYVALVIVILLTIGVDASLHLSMERLDTLRGMVDEMDRRFTRDRDEGLRENAMRWTEGLRENT